MSKQPVDSKGKSSGPVALFWAVWLDGYANDVADVGLCHAFYRRSGYFSPRLPRGGPAFIVKRGSASKAKYSRFTKIRTMANDAESKSGPVWTAGISDPRVTALGKFMRASHLDELPQLFNVLKGGDVTDWPSP